MSTPPPISAGKWADRFRGIPDDRRLRDSLWGIFARHCLRLRAQRGVQVGEDGPSHTNAGAA